MHHVASIVVTLALAGTSFADTITVCQSGCDYSDIMGALGHASNGDVIEVNPNGDDLPGIGYMPFTIEDNLTTITINGNGALIQGMDDAVPPSGVSVEVGVTVTINDLRITGISKYQSALPCFEQDNDGAGMFVESGATVTLNNCTISDNAATEGGGIFVEGNGATVTLNNCRISGNTPDNIYGPTTTTLRGESSPAVIILENSTICGTGEHIKGVLIEHRGENHISDCVDEGDLNGDGDVDAADLDALHDELGICKGDVNHDGVVDGKDLGSVLGAWGLSCDG